jgi:hypothetical protein
MLLPKNCNNKAGVMKIPAMLLMTVLHNAVATMKVFWKLSEDVAEIGKANA